MNLVEVFNDTFRQSLGIISNTTKHTFEDIIPANISTYKDNISVINIDTVSTLIKYSDIGKSCILNMASYKRPGGGVANGARAQEECLFRCSNLIHSISNEFYPLALDVALYTKDAIFFKDKNYLNVDDIVCDVITIPAINLAQPVSNYRIVTKDKIRLMLSLAYKNNVKTIILGAWGCGVFGNDPNDVSKYFKEILVEECYSSYFENVLFSIINDHNSVGNNYDIFSKILV